MSTEGIQPQKQHKGVKNMSVKEEIHSQIVGGLANATFPINTPEDLLAAFPAGADTTCKSGDVEVTAGEAGKLLTAEDFPIESAKQIADILVERAGL
jgi:Uncharacterized protein conserved in archaea